MRPWQSRPCERLDPLSQARNVLLNIEHRLMLHFAPDLDALPLMQRVEVFQVARHT